MLAPPVCATAAELSLTRILVTLDKTKKILVETARAALTVSAHTIQYRECSYFDHAVSTFRHRTQAQGDTVVFVVSSSNLVLRTLAVVEVVKRLVGGLHQTSSFVESAATRVSLGKGARKMARQFCACNRPSTDRSAMPAQTENHVANCHRTSPVPPQRFSQARLPRHSLL